MIDEMTCAFDSPGSVSKVLIIILLSRDPKKMRGAEQGPQKTEMRRSFSALSSRSGWLRSPSRPRIACHLAQLRGCKLNANTESRIRAANKAVPECDADIKCDSPAQH